MKNNLVLEREKRHVRAGQFFTDVLIPRLRGRLVVAIREHCVNAAFARQRGDLVRRHAVPHDHAAARVAQGFIEFDQAGMNKRNAAIVLRQGRENFAVENEGAQHPATAS